MPTAHAALMTDGADDGGWPEGRAPSLIAALLRLAERDPRGMAGVADEIGVDRALLSRATRFSGRNDRLGIVSCTKVVHRYPRLADACAAYLAAVYGWPMVRALAMLGGASGDADDD